MNQPAMNQHGRNQSQSHPRLTEVHDAVDLCGRLHDAAARLSDLLARETAFLQDNRPQEISSLQPEKTTLSKMYAKDFGLFKANAKFVGATAPTQADRLRRALRTLQTEIQKNFTALEATRAVSEGLMNAIFEIAKSKRAGPKCYTNGASMAQHRPTAPTALAVDRSL